MVSDCVLSWESVRMECRVNEWKAGAGLASTVFAVWKLAEDA